MSTALSMTAEGDKPPSPRRWIPLSVRICAALLVMLGVGSLWIVVPAFRRSVAIREIERLGGTVNFRRRVPQWLRDVAGSRDLGGAHVTGWFY
jgi:hypothetical protein